MSKKLFISLVVGFVVGMPAVTLASDGYPAGSAGKVVGGIGCDTVIGNDGKPYPSQCNKTLYKIKDGRNTCYITDSGAISCIGGN